MQLTSWRPVCLFRALAEGVLITHQHQSLSSDALGG